MNRKLTQNRHAPVKRHRGVPGHTQDTRDTRAHAGTRITRTNLTTIQTQRHTRTTARRPWRRPKPVKRHRGEPGHTHRSFVRSFQGPLGQTHTHMPRKGARGDTHASVACCLHKNKLRMWVLGSQIEVTLELSCQTRLTGGGGQLDYGIAVGSYEELGICCFYTECQNKMIRVCSV